MLIVCRKRIEFLEILIDIKSFVSSLKKIQFPLCSIEVISRMFCSNLTLTFAVVGQVWDRP